MIESSKRHLFKARPNCLTSDRDVTEVEEKAGRIRLDESDCISSSCAQKQKVNICHAMYSNTDIQIFDARVLGTRYRHSMSMMTKLFSSDHTVGQNTCDMRASCPSHTPPSFLSELGSGDHEEETDKYATRVERER